MDQSSDAFDQANEADLAEQRAAAAETSPPEDRADMSSEEANEADVAEQRTPVVETSAAQRPDVSSDQANEADILEQGAVVDDDEEDYQRDGG